jgi:phage baseplate assembly protein W
MSTRDLVGRGFPFPFKPNANRQLQWSEGPARVQDAIWIILNTSLGERLMRPTFGGGMLDQLFEPNSEMGRAGMAQQVSAALVKWEPRIDLVEVRVDPSPDVDGQVLASVTYKMRDTNELFNLVYPLYLAEGAG